MASYSSPSSNGDGSPGGGNCTGGLRFVSATPSGYGGCRPTYSHTTAAAGDLRHAVAGRSAARVAQRHAARCRKFVWVGVWKLVEAGHCQTRRNRQSVGVRQVARDALGKEGRIE